MKCPACKKTLIIIERCNIQLDYCPFCKGIWFDQNELEMLSEALGDIDFMTPDLGFLSTAKINEEKRKCPRCNAVMDKVIMNQKPPVLDTCPNNHGFWFDANELQEYVQNNTIRNAGAPIVFLSEVFNAAT